MAKWFPDKDPDEVLDYQLDWTGALDDGDTIATSAWTIVTAPDVVLEIDSDTSSSSTTTVWLSGGTLGERYALRNRITTTGGRTMDQTVSIRIRTR